MTSPEPYYPIIWYELGNYARALAEAERQKAADFLRLIADRSDSDDALRRILDSASTGDEVTLVPKVTSYGSEVFVDYYVVEDRCLAFVQHPNQDVRAFDIPLGYKELSDAVALLRLLFDGDVGRLPIVRNYPWDIDLDFIDQIGNKLMPFASELSSSSVIYFFAHGPLHNFPFHIVRDDQGVPLIAKAAVAHGISRRLLSLVRASGSRDHPRTALAIGVPAANEPHPEYFFGDAEFFGSLGLDAESLETPVETKADNVLRKLADFDLVHINSHGQFSAIDPLDSALLLSDGVSGPVRFQTIAERPSNQILTARQLFKLRMKADVVTLRACSSGVTTVRHGDEQEGMLRGLLHAGAATCFVARWKIDLYSSRELLRSLYRYWLVGRLPKVIALQRAQLDMIRHETEYYRHPFHWAPFVLVGSGD